MSTKIKKLAIYYGWPSAVNSTYTVPAAINVFKSYDLVVFGAGLEDETHGDHINTKDIITGLNKTKVYGYVDSTLALDVLKTKIDKWHVMGVAGIFCDEFGYDFGLTGAAQNDLVDYIHSKNLSAFVNVWNPDDAFAPTSTLATHLGSKDWILAESYQIINDEYQPTADWIARSEKLNRYKSSTGIHIAGITTTLSGVYDQDKFDYAYFSALLYDLDAFGWGEQNFSALSAQLPLRPRKQHHGKEYVSDVVKDEDILYRFTNVGFKVNTITKKVDFLI